MPGVPSSRGCEACRKRKKRCDLAQPSCSRCTPFNICCVGSGKQRYKFQPADEVLVRPTAPHGTSASTSNALVPIVNEPAGPLYNEVTIACGAFVSTLVVSDPRAFTGAMASARSGRIAVQALADYGSAMKALRASLANPDMAKTPETLVATYLLGLCQAYLGDTDDHYRVHMHGLAMLVEKASLEQWEDPFHGEVLISAAFGVVLASISEPTLQLSPAIIDISKRVYEPDPDPLFVNGVETSLRLENLCLFPVFAQEPELHMPEMQSSYQTMILESRRVTDLINEFVDAMDNQDSQLVVPLGRETPTQLLKTYFAHEGVNMIMLALVFMLNKSLRLAEPQNSSLCDDADFLSAECLKAAKRSYKFKPLGALLTPLALGVAWASTADGEKRFEAAKRLDEFTDDLLGSKFIRLAVELEARYRCVGQKLGHASDHDSCMSQSQGVSSVESSSPAWREAPRVSGEAAACCVM